MKKDKFSMNIFHNNYMEFVRITSNWKFPKCLKSEFDILVFVIEGDGKLYDDQVSTVIEKGDLFVLHSRMPERSIVIDREPITIYYIEFSCTQVWTKQGEWYIENELVPPQGKINMKQIPIVHHYINELYNIWCEGVIDTFKVQYFFSAIWALLLEKSSENEYKLDSNQVIINIVKHVNEYYHETFQIEQMAQFTGMSTTSFYQAFKKHTSLTPNQYVTKKRIDKARNLLMTNQLKMLEIAKEVGYQDAYYFSRVFKKVVGISPHKYQKSLKRKIVVLTPAFVGHLLALGVPREYIVLMLDKEKQQKQMHKWGIYANLFQLEQLRKEKPHIIIGTDKDILNYDNLAEIAPTWLIPYKKKKWREQFIQLAAIIHVKEVALSWLQFYDLKAVSAGDRIREQISNNSILVARIFNDGIRIFGQRRRKVGDLLYRDLKLKAPTSTSDFHFKDVSHLEDLNYFNADNILLLDDKNSHRTEITSLKGNVYRAQVSPWLNYSALGQEQGLDEAIKIFAHK